MPHGRRILPAIVVAQSAGTSLRFAGNAVLPDLQRDWGLPVSALGTPTAAGPVLGLSALRPLLRRPPSGRAAGDAL